MTNTTSITYSQDYVTAYTSGKKDALERRKKKNPFNKEEIEKHTGYEDGYYDNQHKPTY